VTSQTSVTTLLEFCVSFTPRWRSDIAAQGHGLGNFVSENVWIKEHKHCSNEYTAV